MVIMAMFLFHTQRVEEIEGNRDLIKDTLASSLYVTLD